MTEAEHADHGNAAGQSGCGCSSKAAAAEAETAKACCGGHDHAGHIHPHGPGHPEPKSGVLDPVCGMTVDPATSKHRFDYRGETFHFGPGRTSRMTSGFSAGWRMISRAILNPFNDICRS